MDKTLLYKLLGIAFLSALLMVPLTMIREQITARSSYQEQVKREIAQTAAGEQTLAGPVLAIRYRVRMPTGTFQDAETGQMMPRYAFQQEERTVLLPADRLDIKGKANVEQRYRGIYQARLYHMDLALEGKFTVPADLTPANLEGSQLVDARAVLLMGISDLNGVDNDPEAQINGHTLRFQPSGDERLASLLPGNALAIELGNVPSGQVSHFNFSIPLMLTGTEHFSILPTAQVNDIQVVSDWRHPSFQGKLPKSRDVGNRGFTAQWNIISRLTRPLTDSAKAASATAPRQEAVSIGFMEPVNIYQQSERAVKYGILFIALTFAAFFLGEILRRQPMHVMQYLLVGLALTIFFLLLIALSEHLPFLYAYLGSAVACIGLITVYLSGVLGAWVPALKSGAGFAGLYGALYVVLQAEDEALLIGSLLLFAVLAAIMLSTRRLDWYQLSNARPENFQHRTGSA
ncbi:MAG: cell envelope integrity protein CreD [Zoogloeaceae bacterium]|nr:cell envelope integrity protein CreD [Zoogloeaceae bacterium]